MYRYISCDEWTILELELPTYVALTPPLLGLPSDIQSVCIVAASAYSYCNPLPLHIVLCTVSMWDAFLLFLLRLHSWSNTGLLYSYMLASSDLQ